MRSTHIGRSSQAHCVKFVCRTFFALVLSSAAIVLAQSPASALGAPGAGVLQSQIKQNSDVITVYVVRRGAAVRRRTVVGPRGGVASRTVVRRGAVVRPGVRGAWVRPGWYRWAPGGAIAAGAAIGFVTAATAVAWAGAPPAPGYCWYYSDPSRTKGFWDACPH
jgi:hypothetical protein